MYYLQEYNQFLEQASLDRGYTSLGGEEQPAASGQRSEYMTPRSLEIAEMSTVDESSLNV